MNAGSRDSDPKRYRNYFDDPLSFASCSPGFHLRGYQSAPMLAIIHSVKNKLGLSIVVLFPRQSGKNELQAHLEAYLLTRYKLQDAEMVKVSPTWKPQSLNAMRRLERVLRRNSLVEGRWIKESNYVYRVGRARMYFLSGMSGTNIVGTTATHLLEVDEAQEVSIDKYDKEIAPMAASSNATRVFWGTAWTRQTLLARELAAARELEELDGMQRVFVLTAEEVAKEVPAYGEYVKGQVARLGRNNPMVRTQYYSETIEAEGGMFNATRRALMQGKHAPQDAPISAEGRGDRVEGQGKRCRAHMYAITIDVAGEDEAARDPAMQGWAGHRWEGMALANPGRDSTALTIFDVDASTLEDALIGRPTYQVVGRQQWTGIKHSSLFARLTAIINHWSPTWLVIDATGVGQTLASFLLDRYPNITLPFVFTSASKSALGWDFITLIETGRYKEYAARAMEEGIGDKGKGNEGSGHRLQAEFWRQVEACQYGILDGPGKLMRWGVPDGTRDPATGEVVHDDLVISAALVCAVDDKPFGRGESKVVPGPEIFGGREY